MVHYERLVGEIKAKLSQIRNDYLAESEGVCHRLDDGRVLRLPDDYLNFLTQGLDNAKKLGKFHAICRYKSEEARCSAYERFAEISELVNIAKLLDNDLRLLLDRGIMRALFRRPKNDEIKLLNDIAHPSEKVLMDPQYSLALLWLSRWPGPGISWPDAERNMRRLKVYDRSLLAYYARQLTPAVAAFHAIAYLKVSLIPSIAYSTVWCLIHSYVEVGKRPRR